jgi:hypothetical protein
MTPAGNAVLQPHMPGRKNIERPGRGPGLCRNLLPGRSTLYLT